MLERQREMSIEAPTLEEAITKACVELGVTSDALDFEIIDKGSRGIFGIGKRPCVIMAKRKGDTGFKKDDSKLSPGESAAGSGLKDKGFKKAELKGEPLKESKDNKKKTFGKKIIDREEETFNAEENTNSLEKKPVKRPERPSVKRSPRKDRPPIRRKNDAQDSSDVRSSERGRASAPGVDEKRKNLRFRPGDKKDKRAIREKREKTPIVLTEDPGERARDFLSGLFSAAGFDIAVSASYSDEKAELSIDLDGEDVKDLIGRRGMALDALQYLTGQVVNKRQNGHIRVKLDTANFREKRKENLQEFAIDMAKKVKETGRPIVLDPMNAYERRLIHSVLQSEKGVDTHSEGEEPYRHVVIRPIKKKETETKDINENARDSGKI